MRCNNCGSESGDIEFSMKGRRFFHCFSCMEFTVIDNPLLDRTERDVG